MHFELDGKRVFASTGGRQHRPDQDWIIFIHGAGGSHLVWSQQVRAFAYDEYNVLALDLPAHGDSEGVALDNVDAMAAWVVAVMDKLNISRAHLVNHSLGGLVSLEIAANNAERIKSVTFIAAAMAIAVNKVLIELSKNDRPKAYEFMHSGFFGRYGQAHDSSVPGSSLIGLGMRVMENNHQDALTADLIACASYNNGGVAASKVLCPCLCLLAGADAMVGLKYGQKLCQALSDCKQHVFEGSGHLLTSERPREINAWIRQFFSDRF